MANELDATVASFDWVMSGLRCHEDVWSVVEEPVELQRRVGWDLLSRIAEQQLRGAQSCILDLVAREQPRQEWAPRATGTAPSSRSSSASAPMSRFTGAESTVGDGRSLAGLS
jgi:hypothetical protein